MEKEVRELRVEGMFSFFCIEMYFYWSDPYNINDQFIHKTKSEREGATQRTEVRRKFTETGLLKPSPDTLRINKVSPRFTLAIELTHIIYEANRRPKGISFE